MPQENNKTIKYKRQIFSSEISNVLKDIGDYAFVLDKDDYIIKISDNTYKYAKENYYISNQIKQLKIIYKQEVHNKLQELFDLYSQEYEDIDEVIDDILGF